jgi:predicted aldo/keto reductase-like oxidoreductase
MAVVNPAAFSRPSLEQQIPAAVEKGMGVIAMKIFGGRPGPLAGKGEGQEGAGRLLRFAWSQPISIAIPGVATRKQFFENLEAARAFVPLTAEEQKAMTRRASRLRPPWQLKKK